MNPSAIFSKTGKGVQETGGKTSHLSRADRAVLAVIDGKTALGEVAKKFEKIAPDKFNALIAQLDKDGFIREVSSGAAAPAPARPAARASPPPAKPAAGPDEELDFTAAIGLPPKAPAAASKPTLDLAAASRAEAEKKAKEQELLDYRSRQQAEAKAKADAEAKIKAARDAAVRLAAEAKAKAEAEAKVKSDAAEARARKESEDKARIEAELKGRLEAERRAREDAERKAAEATETARRELEEKAKRDAEELRQKLEAEMRAKLEEERVKAEAERKAREEEDRKRREEEDRRRREEEEARRAKEEAERKARAEEERKHREEEARRRKEEDERRAKEAAERKAREEEERKRREEEARRRREEDERRAREEAERKAKEEAERKARAEEERRRREEEEARRAKEEAERKAKQEEDDRRRKEDEERRAQEDAERKVKRDEEDRRRKEEDERRARDDAERRAKEAAEAAAPAAAAPAAPPAKPVDDLLADLDAFSMREDEEAKAKEEAARKAKEEAARKAREEEERREREEAEARGREEGERRRKADEERRAQEEAAQREREEDERKAREEAERKQKAKDALAAKKAADKKPAAAAPSGDDDIVVTDDDLDMEDVKRDEKALSPESRKAAREREREQGRRDGTATATIPPKARKPVKWGKPLAIGLFVALLAAVGLLHLMPVSTGDYEKAASEALGVPVKIGSGRLSVLTGVELRFERVSIGDALTASVVRGSPDVGSLFGARKSFSKIEFEGVSLSQADLGAALFGKAEGGNFNVARVVARQVKLDGPLALPALDIEAAIGGGGALQSVTLRGADKLSILLSPRGAEIGVEMSAGALAVPFVPALNLVEFGLKGTATRQGLTVAEFDGRSFDGLISGTGRIRWGASWAAEGEVRMRGVNAAVFAPTLVSEGKAEGRGVYSMRGAVPARLYESARLEGNFKVEKGVLGSFDLMRALQTGGGQSGGRTLFNELNAQVVYDKGATQLRNVLVSAGAMSANASLDIDAGGGLAGRVAAEVKTPAQTLRGTLAISGKLQEPIVRK